MICPETLNLYVIVTSGLKWPMAVLINGDHVALPHDIDQIDQFHMWRSQIGFATFIVLE